MKKDIPFGTYRISINGIVVKRGKVKMVPSKGRIIMAARFDPPAQMTAESTLEYNLTRRFKGKKR